MHAPFIYKYLWKTIYIALTVTSDNTSFIYLHFNVRHICFHNEISKLIDCYVKYR